MIHSLLPRSLRDQFLVAAIVLVVLMVASGGTALYSLRAVTEATRTLAQRQLLDLQQAQALVQQTLLIERESVQLDAAPSITAMRQSYSGIVQDLTTFDHLVDQLASDTDDPAVLDLRQSSQLFRNTANVVAQLRQTEPEDQRDRASSDWQPGICTGRAASPTPTTSEQLRGQMHREAGEMVAAAQRRSVRYRHDFEGAVQGLAVRSARNQRWMTVLLAISLLSAWVFIRVYLVGHVLGRLQRVSRRLRDGSRAADEVPMPGDDEIAEMASAVEAFHADRQQLAVAHAELQLERTQQESLIRELAQVHGQLLQSEKMASIGQLAAGVAHEINNPVSYVTANVGTLQGYVNDLLNVLCAYEIREEELTEPSRAALAGLKKQLDIGYLREDAAALLGESMEGLQRVRSIVQGLKDFAHVDTTEKQLTDLEHNLESTVRIVWSELKHKADLMREYAPVPQVECIPSQINQVFMNVLVNAVQAIDGHGRITLRTGHGNGTVWVEVEDTGSGISEEHRSRIFDPFFTTKPVGVGTGLGLSISYGIVRHHGGCIEVKSEPGKGSCFRVVLPLDGGHETVAEAVQMTDTTERS